MSTIPAGRCMVRGESPRPAGLQPSAVRRMKHIALVGLVLILAGCAPSTTTTTPTTLGPTTTEPPPLPSQELPVPR